MRFRYRVQHFAIGQSPIYREKVQGRSLVQGSKRYSISYNHDTQQHQAEIDERIHDRVCDSIKPRRGVVRGL